MEDKLILVGRLRPVPYTINYTNSQGNIQSYIWQGSKGKKVDSKSIPQMVVDYLSMNSTCFTDGELVIMEEEAKKDILDSIDEPDKYENNTHSREEIEKILNSTVASMKKQLNKIDVLSEKHFVVQVAKEMELDSKTKLKFLAEWLGVAEDLLFE